MYAQISGGEVIRVIKSPVELEVGGKKHPRHIFLRWSKPKLAAIGIYPYRENRTDSRYYHTGQLTYEIGDEVVGSYETKERDPAQLKKGMIEKTRTIASSLLSRDDWMSIRESEGGTPMPDEIKIYRSEIRLESNTKELEIDALITLGDVMEYENRKYTEVRKEEHSDNKGNVTYGPETYTSNREINMVTHYEAIDPSVEVNPSFVSLTLG